MFGGCHRVLSGPAAVVAIAVGIGCSNDRSDDGSEPSVGGTSASGSGGGVVGGNGSAGAVATAGAGGRDGSTGGQTCGTGGSASPGGAGGESGDPGAPTCGLIVFTSPPYDSACQQALEENCCAEIAACATSPLCKRFTDCVNACDPPSDACIACCASGLTEPPGELEYIAACTKSGLPFPDDCAWPPQ